MEYGKIELMSNLIPIKNKQYTQALWGSYIVEDFFSKLQKMGFKKNEGFSATINGTTYLDVYTFGNPIYPGETSIKICRLRDGYNEREFVIRDDISQFCWHVYNLLVGLNVAIKEKFKEYQQVLGYDADLEYLRGKPSDFDSDKDYYDDYVVIHYGGSYLSVPLKVSEGRNGAYSIKVPLYFLMGVIEKPLELYYKPIPIDIISKFVYDEEETEEEEA